MCEVDMEWCAEGEMDALVDSLTVTDAAYEVEGETRYVHRLVQNGKSLFRSRTRWAK